MPKSKPIGVRFDLEKLELIQKEQNLKSPQAVLNYFMDNYGVITPKLADIVKDVKISVKKEKLLKSPKNDKLEPPIGLTGINLAIWKAENKK